jgi:hypothetical protein
MRSGDSNRAVPAPHFDVHQENITEALLLSGGPLPVGRRTIMPVTPEQADRAERARNEPSKEAKAFFPKIDEQLLAHGGAYIRKPLGFTDEVFQDIKRTYERLGWNVTEEGPDQRETDIPRAVRIYRD